MTTATPFTPEQEARIREIFAGLLIAFDRHIKFYGEKQVRQALELALADETARGASD